MIRQYTATVYIFDKEQVLLIHHRKLNKWLPPGGHVDPNELPSDAARREAFEETGLEIELIKNEEIWISKRNATSFERPYMCLLEEIPERVNEPAHQHMDFIYIGKVAGGTINHNEIETQGIRWFTLTEIELLESEKDIFEETKITLRKMFSIV